LLTHGQANKQTKSGKNITSLADVNKLNYKLTNIQFGEYSTRA